MVAAERRNKIGEILSGSVMPISASSLAAQLGVSRQIIVGDIALLRAQGFDIVATARGYMIAPVMPAGRYVGKIVCKHTPGQTEEELATIVRLEGIVADVIVEHPVYGEITGQLNISTQEDVTQFMDRVRENQVKLLSDLTGGIHTHTLICHDRQMFEQISATLDRLSLLYRGE